MKGFIVVLAAAITLCACTKNPGADLTIDPTVSPANQTLIRQAVAQLVNSCVRFHQRPHDLTNWHATEVTSTGGEHNYLTDKLGWTRWVKVTIHVRPNARALPEGNIGGKVLTYYLGGGELPGIAANTRVSQFVCGPLPLGNDTPNSFTFSQVPDLKLLDSLK